MNKTIFAVSVTALMFGFASTTFAQERQIKAQDNRIAQAQTQTPQSDVSEQTFFVRPPRFVRAATSQPTIYTPSTYEFTLVVPADAGQPLKAVTISQDPSQPIISFDSSQSRASTGERIGKGAKISLASIGGEQPANRSDITVAFDQPVQPGSTVTVALFTNGNPSTPGAYELGITAYPAGADARGQFLGYRRVNLYSSGSN